MRLLRRRSPAERHVRAGDEFERLGGDRGVRIRVDRAAARVAAERQRDENLRRRR